MVEQVHQGRGCSLLGIHTRAQEKCAKEGAAERNDNSFDHNLPCCCSLPPHRH